MIGHHFTVHRCASGCSVTVHIG
ncbi:uncharacterized protein METZ01_LOCUS198158, partial [marine metagenome]